MKRGYALLLIGALVFSTWSAHQTSVDNSGDDFCGYTLQEVKSHPGSPSEECPDGCPLQELISSGKLFTALQNSNAHNLDQELEEMILQSTFAGDHSVIITRLQQVKLQTPKNFITKSLDIPS